MRQRGTKKSEPLRRIENGTIIRSMKDGRSKGFDVEESILVGKPIWFEMVARASEMLLV
jgi:hypothetical protein